MPSVPQARSLHVTVEGDKAVIRVTDEALSDDGGTSAKRLTDVIDDLAQRDVTLDFRSVRVLNSLALTTLLALNKKLRAAAGRLRVVKVSPEVYEVFAVTRLTTILEIRQNEAA